jgi:hypothetical protein
VRIFYYLEDRERVLESPTDKLLLSVTAFAGEMEREKARQRTHDALVRKARAGYVECLGLSTLIERHLLAGYEDTNDAEQLAEDPTFRMLASRERRETSVALTSTLHWFETEVLTAEQNYQGLLRLNIELVQPDATRTVSQRSIARRAPSTARKSRRRITATSSPSAIIPSSSSTRTATASPPSSAPATSIVRMGGTRCCSPSSTGSRVGGGPSLSAPTRRLPSRRSTRRWNAGG